MANETIQTLADGTHITQAAPVRFVYRDSQGRVREEMPFPVGPRATDVRRSITITDPVAGYRYALDAQQKIAHRSTMPRPSAQPQRQMVAANRAGVMRSGDFASERIAMPLPAPVSPGDATAVSTAHPANLRAGDGRPQPEFNSESLATQMVDGVLCEGQRMTTTYPVDFMGNDRPIVVTTEAWRSPESQDDDPFEDQRSALGREHLPDSQSQPRGAGCQPLPPPGRLQRSG